MKTYKITVNGKTYMVEVEEAGANETAAPAQATQSAPVSHSSGHGEPVEAPIQGTLLSIKVSQGDSVKKGQVLAILEAMKLENEIACPIDGVISSISAKEGQVVDSGDLLMTIESK